jgi:putative ABC transport system substrate-binding protein
MNRRSFLNLLGGAAAAWPLGAMAQQLSVIRRIGVLISIGESDAEGQAFVAAFREGLQRLNWTEGRNLRIDYRWGAANVDSIRRFAKELVALQPDLILSQSTVTTESVLQESRTIPIIFTSVSDPIGAGFIANLARPGGSVTGFLTIEDSMAGKWLELLREIAPHVRRVAFMYNPETAPFAEYYLSAFKSAAASVAVEAVAAPIHAPTELEPVIADQARVPNSGLIAMPDTFMITRRVEVISLANRYRLPAIYPFRYFATDGGLLSYGSDQVDNFRRAAIYADRILKGIKPSELPVQAPVKFELVVNAKTAKALGLEVPSSFYWRADEVIE